MPVAQVEINVWILPQISKEFNALHAQADFLARSWTSQMIFFIPIVNDGCSEWAQRNSMKMTNLN